jgi:hypothetical protein
MVQQHCAAKVPDEACLLDIRRDDFHLRLAQAFLSFESLGDARFIAGFLVSSAMGLLLTYTSMLCTIHNSPLTTSIAGNAKDVLTTVVGALLFPGFVATVQSVGGLALSFVGAFAYSAISALKLRSAAAAKAAAASTAPAVDEEAGTGPAGGDAALDKDGGTAVVSASSSSTDAGSVSSAR